MSYGPYRWRSSAARRPTTPTRALRHASCWPASSPSPVIGVFVPEEDVLLRVR